MARFFIACLLSFSLSAVTKSQFTNSGNLTFFSGSQLSFLGDVTNNGNIVDSSLVLTMSGTNAQSIGGTSVTVFNNLTINNSNSTGVSLYQGITIRGHLQLTNGKLVTSSTSTLTLTNNATTSGASNSSFVSGPMFKTGNQDFTFPVGKNAVYAPISISAPALSTDQFCAEYFQLNPDLLYSVFSLDPSLDHVSTCEYWMLNPTSGTSSVTVTPSWDTRSCGVDNPADLRVARWDGTEWKNEGNSAITGTPSSGTVTSTSTLNTFGPFTLASISGSNILPIELIDFGGYCDLSETILTWNTASEIGNDYFVIERSIDGIHWEQAGTEDGAGNSSQLIKYRFADPQHLVFQTIYYRISQVDYNGFAEIVASTSVTNCEDNVLDKKLVVYPNPSSGEFNLIFEDDLSGAVSLEVLSSLGEKVYASGTFESTLDLSSLPAGIYFIYLNAGDQVIVEKITLE